MKLYWRGELIKVHPVVTPGRRPTVPADLPSELTAYPTRDLNALHRKASAYGEHVGAIDRMLSRGTTDFAVRRPS